MSYQIGQFFRDTVNGDLLKILSFSQEEIDETKPYSIEYCRCACILPDGTPFGVQEMKTAHFERDRFSEVTGIKKLWYRWKYRKLKLVR